MVVLLDECFWLDDLDDSVRSLDSILVQLKLEVGSFLQINPISAGNAGSFHICAHPDCKRNPHTQGFLRKFHKLHDLRNMP